MSDRIQASAISKTIALTKFAGVSPRVFEALLRHFGSIDRIIHADSGTLMSVAGMSADLANDISSAAKSLDKAETFLQNLRERDIHALSRFDDDYPHLLFELNDPPPVLYFRGSLPNPERKSVSIVGADDATSPGIELTTNLTKLFIGAGVQVISSLNTGADSAVHLGAKGADGKSFAILESGFNNIYPEEHISLAIDIAATGGAITEYIPETKHKQNSHEEANRLIVGMSQAVVVTEIYQSSERVLDLLSCCSQLGKLAFLMIDPKHGALADEKSLNAAVSYGAIPMVGWDKVPDIVDALV